MNAISLMVRKHNGRWFSVQDSEIGSLNPVNWQEAIVTPSASERALEMARLIQTGAERALPLSDVKNVLRCTSFIFDGTTHHLPHPTSMGGGWARHLWFKQSGFVGPEERVAIASPAVWDSLAKDHSVAVMNEYADGTFGVTEG
jgi:hypothetical protein